MTGVKQQPEYAPLDADHLLSTSPEMGTPGAPAEGSGASARSVHVCACRPSRRSAVLLAFAVTGVALVLTLVAATAGGGTSAGGAAWRFYDERGGNSSDGHRGSRRPSRDLRLVSGSYPGPKQNRRPSRDLRLVSGSYPGHPAPGLARRIPFDGPSVQQDAPTTPPPAASPTTTTAEERDDADHPAERFLLADQHPAAPLLATVETRNDAERFPAAGLTGMTFINLGSHRSWDGFRTKVQLYRSWVHDQAQQSPGRVLVLADGGDMAYGGCSEEQMIARYWTVVTASKGPKVVCGADTVIWPVHTSWHTEGPEITDSWKYKGFEERKANVLKAFGLEKDPYRPFLNKGSPSFVNSGFLMGPASDLLEVLNCMMSIDNGPDFDDQLALTECMFKTPDRIAIDYSGSLVLNLQGFRRDVLEGKDGVLRNKVTATPQCFVHFNAFAPLQKWAWLNKWVQDSGAQAPAPPPPPAPQAFQQEVACAGAGKDCRASKCCQDQGLQCYEKNEYWASCNATCEARRGTAEGAWTCRVLGHGQAPPVAPAPTPAPPTAPTPAPPTGITSDSGRQCGANPACGDYPATVNCCPLDNGESLPCCSWRWQ